MKRKRHKKKRNYTFSFTSHKNGGPDGTRTRDLLRDRQAF
ncbi:hypothetical protein BPJM79_220001 [Bacillus pumilus]